MRLLLDTHVLLWWLDDSEALSRNARSVIADPENAVYVSAVSVWEIVLKASAGKLDIPVDWADAIAEEPFRHLSVTREHALKVAELPPLHRDPFDRLLVAQSLVEELVLVTHDPDLTRYGISTLNT
jgi:PIN domain nuclease of toxin-antitoxin system